MQFDVLIVGAGPAGSSAAYWISHAGFSVALIDKFEFPRDKTCGDGLIPDALTMLTKMGCLDAVLERSFGVKQMRFYSPSLRYFDIDCRCEVIQRMDLDYILQQHSVASGATPIHAHIRSLTPSSDGVLALDGTHQVIAKAKYCILATGANVGLLRSAGFPCEPKASLVATRFYLDSDYVLPHISIQVTPDMIPSNGYGWIFPLPNGKYNIGVGCEVPQTGRQPDLNVYLAHFLDTFPDAKALMRHKRSSTSPTAAVLRTGLNGSLVQKDRILAIGECIGTTFPLTGEGIGKAMESAEIAATHVIHALHSGNLSDLEGYSKDLQTRLAPKYAGYQLAEKWSNHRWFIELICYLAHRSPRIRKKLQAVIEEKIDFRTALRPLNLLKLLGLGCRHFLTR
jgi:geranylgeranyl reductase family protein